MIFTTISEAKKQTGLSYLGGISLSSKMMHSKIYSHQYTYAIYLAPANLSGYNVCSHSTSECRLGCLNTSGHAGMEIISGKSKIIDCRNKKVRLFYEEPEFFFSWLVAEIKHYRLKAIKDNYYFSVRLNATSDIDWQNIKFNGLNIFDIFQEINFYDYTKSPLKFNNKPDNYHLTFSYTGKNIEQCKQLLKSGYNIAVVFNVKKESELPISFMGYPVINGDLTDFRIDDAKGVIVGLKWKRIANKEVENEVLKSCFVVQPNDIRCDYNKIKELYKNIQKRITFV